MKKIQFILVLFMVVICCISCKKDIPGSPNNSALNIIHASVGLPLISANFTFSPVGFSASKATLSYGSSLEYGNLSGNLPVELISSQDTLHSFYKNTLNLKAGGIYSLYIIGQSPQTETMLLEDQIPSFQDSTSAVRFINLSPNSKPITINLQGNPTSQTEFPSLAYKQISIFKGYSAKSTFVSNGYTFEVRDAVTGNLLTTFSWRIKPFFCNTLVIDGLENDNTGNYPVSVFQINHY